MLWVKTGATIAGLLVARTAYLYVKAFLRAAQLKRMNPSLTVHTVPAVPFSILVMFGLLPNWVIKGFDKEWPVRMKYKVFQGTHLNTFAIVGPHNTVLCCADPDLTHEMMVSRWTEFRKPTHNYGVLDIFGQNVVTTEGSEWRRHRKFSAPSFSEKNMYLVHEETIAAMRMMFAAWESQAKTNGVDIENKGEFVVNVSRDMFHMALAVISAAAFGVRLDWESENDIGKKIPEGHQMSFQQSLEIVMYRLTQWLLFPKFLFKLPIKYLRETKDGYEDFKKYMLEFIKVAEKNENSTLLSLLVKAGSEENEDQGLSKDELVGNAFIFLVAGHETTAGVLNYALAHLAINPDIQEKLHNEVTNVIGDNDLPSYNNYNEFPYIHAIMHETLRLNAAVSLIPKWTGDQERTLGPYVISPKTNVDIITYGLHYNPKVWGPDVNEYRPERFLSDPASVAKSNWNKNAFAPFSEGPRSCLGKKFSQVEFCCALAMLSQKYTWRLQPGTNVEKMMESSTLLTTKTTLPVKLLFKRR
ncbi:hypothetical protein HDV05_007604 [Chytridiales sp. JEL 0842]|nr:hypothetical protein HDV05_007604 [Chytridiales sp. JEL 0842]